MFSSIELQQQEPLAPLPHQSSLEELDALMRFNNIIINEFLKLPSLETQAQLLQRIARRYSLIGTPLFQYLRQVDLPPSHVPISMAALSQSPIAAPLLTFLQSPQPDAAPQPSRARKRKQPASAVATEINLKKGRSHENPLTLAELDQLIKKNEDNEPYIRLKNVILDHAVKRRVIDEVKSKEGRTTRIVTANYTQHIQLPDDGGIIKIKLIPRKFWHEQAYPGDPDCSSWIDSKDELDSEANFEIAGYQFEYEKEDQRILKVVVKVSQPELDVALVEHFPQIIDPKSSEEKKEEKSSSSLAKQPAFAAEIHTVHAGSGAKPASGSDATRVGLSFARLFKPKRLKLVDMSNLQPADRRVPLRLIFAIDNKTWYEKLIPNLKLQQGKIKTAFNGVLDQNPEQYASKLEKLRTSSLEDWYEAFKEQKQDAPTVIAEAAEKLINNIKQCEELASVAASLTNTASLANPKLANAMEVLSKKLDQKLKKYYQLTAEEKSNYKKLSALLSEWNHYQRLLEDLRCPDILIDLAKRHFPNAFKESKEESKATPLKDITIKMLTTVILNKSKSKANEDEPKDKRVLKLDTSKKGPSPDLMNLSMLLCNGLKLEADNKAQYFLKPLDPAKKITPFRDCCHELLWGGLIWEVNQSAPAAALHPVSDLAASSSHRGPALR